jgi:trk system potassium uptake protein TrkH
MFLYLFAGLILIGTLLLLPPFTHHGGGITPFMTALFTATSAITITGLVVENTATYWTRAGQVIILWMIYVGGLGFMTVATFMLILIGQRITLSQRLLVRESLLINQMGGLARLTIGIVIVATAVQVIGFLALFARFYFLYPPAEAVWQAAFLSVSAFNSAGFDVINEPGGFSTFRNDGTVLGIFAILILIGAISYLVIIDIARVRRFSRFTLNTKLVLVTTIVLTLIGVVGFFGPEYQNPQTLGPLSVKDKLIGSILQQVSRI